MWTRGSALRGPWVEARLIDREDLGRRDERHRRVVHRADVVAHDCDQSSGWSAGGRAGRCGGAGGGALSGAASMAHVNICERYSASVWPPMPIVSMSGMWNCEQRCHSATRAWLCSDESTEPHVSSRSNHDLNMCGPLSSLASSRPHAVAHTHTSSLGRVATLSSASGLVTPRWCGL